MTAYKKACACKSTSSGPRFTFWAKGRDEDQVRYGAAWASMACDLCGKPWERVEDGGAAPSLDTPPKP